MQLLPRSLAMFGLLLGLLALVPFGATAQEEPAPTIGDIVVDSYDCETGSLAFHVPVTDLPHIPNSNGPLGATVIGHYEYGQSGLPGFHFNPELEASPFTGNVAISTTVPLTGEESIFPEEASGPLTDIEIRARISETDVSTTTYPVDCGGAVDPTEPPDTGLPAPTVGDIIVDSYDCETGSLVFHVPVTDLPHIPDSNGAVGYSAVAHYDLGPDSSWWIPGLTYNVPPEDSPFTGDLYLPVPTLASTNAGFVYPDGTDPPDGSIVSIEITVHVGTEGGGGEVDTSTLSYPVDCGAVEPTTPPVDPEPTEPDTVAPEDSDDGTEDGSVDGSDDMTSEEPSTESDTSSGAGDAGNDEVTTLPSTGAGVTANQAGGLGLIVALLGVTALLGLAALRLRYRA